MVMTSLSFRDLAHACRPGSMIHNSSDCNSEEGESEDKDSNHNPCVASDVPGKPLAPSFLVISEK